MTQASWFFSVFFTLTIKITTLVLINYFMNSLINNKGMINLEVFMGHQRAHCTLLTILFHYVMCASFTIKGMNQIQYIVLFFPQKYRSSHVFLLSGKGEYELKAQPKSCSLHPNGHKQQLPIPSFSVRNQLYSCDSRSPEYLFCIWIIPSPPPQQEHSFSHLHLLNHLFSHLC